MSIGWQLFDPDTNRFLREGEWTSLPDGTAAGATVAVDLTIDFPRGRAAIVCMCRRSTGAGLAVHARRAVPDDRCGGRGRRRAGSEVGADDAAGAAVAQFRRADFPKIFARPFATMAANRALIRSMVRRDILARYRGSFGDMFWTVLNPLLLMLTYYFVFGVVLRTRFGEDQSSGSFLLYFLAGMLPWLAFSEPVGRSPNSMLEHRNFVKKLVFPLETLPVNQVVAGLVTEVFALVVFVCFVLALRGHVPLTVVWLPVLLVPQLLFTLGLCWFLAGLGVFVRDLAQVMGFILTLWFFITPICYPEQSIPPGLLWVLGKNPMFTLVRAYRAIFLEGRAPDARPLMTLWGVATVMFFFGHAWFYKLRKTFADVI